MKLTVVLLVLAVSHTTKGETDKKKKAEEKTEKRELTEGNAGIEKRAPLLSTASPALSGGVEYADTKNTLPDKSPTQQIYASPVPQIAKISDLLTGQGPSYQNAIANHLYSPVPIYQQRQPSPTIYEVSAPVPSHLAYSEHRLSVATPNEIQYNGKAQRLFKSTNTNYDQPRVIYRQSYEQNPSTLQHVPSSVLGNKAIQFSPIQQPIFQQQQLRYIQEQPKILQPGILYRPEQFTQGRNHQQLEQRDLRNQPAPLQVLEKQQLPQTEYNDKQQNALSYAKFVFNQAAPAYENGLQKVRLQNQQAQIQSQPLLQLQEQHYQQQQQYQFQPRPLTQIDYQLQHPSQQLLQGPTKTPQFQPQPQIQYQEQPQPQIQYQEQPQPQIKYQEQPQPQIQYQEQPQPQIQYQEQPQYLYQQLQGQDLQQQQSINVPQPSLEQAQYQIQPQQHQFSQQQLIKSEPVLSKQSIPERQLYLKQTHSIDQSKSVQPQVQNGGYQGLPTALPTFPPVQYFGKFAQSLFEGHQH